MLCATVAKRRASGRRLGSERLEVEMEVDEVKISKLS
jgi:hypothetical protein